MCVCVCVRAHVNVCLCVRAYVHACMYMYVCAYTPTIHFLGSEFQAPPIYRHLFGQYDI